VSAALRGRSGGCVDLSWLRKLRLLALAPARPEYLLSAFGILPWRCFDCKRRFYGGKVPFRYVIYAHCGKCGNLELISIRRDRLNGGWPAWLAVHLGARALRCDDCRNNFVSWRPQRARRPRPKVKVTTFSRQPDRKNPPRVKIAHQANPMSPIERISASASISSAGNCPSPCHSYRKASIGSSAAARRAG